MKNSVRLKYAGGICPLSVSANSILGRRGVLFLSGTLFFPPVFSFILVECDMKGLHNP